MSDLTPKQRITVAYMHYVRDINQDDLAAIYSVNIGRVSEACTAIKHASEHPNRGKDRITNASES